MLPRTALCAASPCLLIVLPWSCAADCVPGPGMLGCRHHHCNEGGQSLLGHSAVICRHPATCFMVVTAQSL